MPTNTVPSGLQPAEGSRQVIDPALHGTQAALPAKDAQRRPAPGDEAAAGTLGTGEDVCPVCHGSRQINAEICQHCNGNGTIIKAIGGA
jgi:hypothetical protein